jgi:hypothetical protein
MIQRRTGTNAIPRCCLENFSWKPLKLEFTYQRNSTLNVKSLRDVRFTLKEKIKEACNYKFHLLKYCNGGRGTQFVSKWT